MPIIFRLDETTKGTIQYETINKRKIQAPLKNGNLGEHN